MFTDYFLFSLAMLQAPSSLPPATNAPASMSVSSTVKEPTSGTAIIPLAFKEFFEPSAAELKPSSKLLGCNGKHVRIAGFMAQMEEPIKGGFYLCPRPTSCDESGGGTAELPPGSIRVIVRSVKNQAMPFSPRALEVSGILQMGVVTHEDGQVSMLRLILDRPQDLPPSSHASPHNSKPPRQFSNQSQSLSKQSLSQRRSK